MKYTLRKFWLLWLSLLLLGIFVIGYVNAADGDEPDVVIDLSGIETHRSNLYNLKLWSGSTTAGVLNVAWWRVRFSSGLIVWEDHHVTVSDKAVIGWWKENTINAEYVWIGWWELNAGTAEYAVIGGWYKNVAEWQKSVVVWWSENKAEAGGLVVWWSNNKAESLWVILGWNRNTAEKNSLALGSGASSSSGSFAWKGTVSSSNKWKIGARTVLIGTTTWINLVKLVVGGAVKIGWWLGIWYKWEVRYVGNCFYSYDGSKWHVINRGNEEDSWCIGFNSNDVAKYCKFGNTILWNWDSVTWYNVPYATGSNCNTAEHEKKVTCIDWTISPSWYIYPYCYSINS